MALLQATHPNASCRRLYEKRHVVNDERSRIVPRSNKILPRETKIRKRTAHGVLHGRMLIHDGDEFKLFTIREALKAYVLTFLHTASSFFCAGLVA